MVIPFWVTGLFPRAEKVASVSVTDQDPVSGVFDIGTFLNGGLHPDPKPGRKHKAEERFKFRVGNRRKEYLHFFPEGTKRQIRIKLPHGEPGGVPGLMENKHGKENAAGRYRRLCGTVGEGTLLLQPADILPEFLPGNVFWLFAEDSLKVIQIRVDVSGIRFYSMVSKTPEKASPGKL